MLLNSVDGMLSKSSAVSKLLPYAAEASWQTGRWDKLQRVVSLSSDGPGGDFNVTLGRTLLALHQNDQKTFQGIINSLREQIAMSLSATTTDSLGICHDVMLKFHVLSELEMMASPLAVRPDRHQQLIESLDRRLESIGAHLNDKQYLLGIRRAAMQLSGYVGYYFQQALLIAIRSTFTKADIASSWLTSARLARKGNSIHQSFNAVMHASKLGDVSSTIENARLLWRRGDHLQAIQILKGAIRAEAFISQRSDSLEDSVIVTAEAEKNQNLLTARAHLLLAKWLDSAGQTPSSELRRHYQDSVKKHQIWEKGHYYLGRHYNKLLESEKVLAPDQRTDPFYTGETAKLVIENYLRSLNYGTKYIYQTLPRILTLWLELGVQVNQHVDGKYGTKVLSQEVMKGRKSNLSIIHDRFNRYILKMPAYIFYTALPQIVSRIAHPNREVFKYLQQIIIKVVSAHPNQALWTLLAVSMSTQADERQTRGATIIAQLLSTSRKGDPSRQDLPKMIRLGERMSRQLLMICNSGSFSGVGKTITASITRDLGFDHKKCTPCPLAVPVESTLTATLPTLTDSVRTHNAFSRDVVTINSFLDQVLILSSLQRPRRITARGSDGRTYNLLCKPKDDLRKDQRLMEFNTMINRALKRDVESSRRQLYIKTYSVTPLNEACGIIEWIDGLKTLRDILLGLYKERRVTVNYTQLKAYLERAYNDDIKFFTDKVLVEIFPVFHSWFIQQFNDPSAWFVARLKYTRSCAVMSMVGTILGLGDRHGENILFEEGNGGTFHVDFNCLFDKGLTFSQPEKVPFRLTHNMVDAMGVYGYEGPFRKSSELTLRILRQHEETLMTILEAFIYDPTLDFESKQEKKSDKGKHKNKDWPPDTPQGVLDVIRRKVRGLLKGEAIPLGVEGHVDWLIRQATDPVNLSGMYIGWCCFF
jgi:serine/threonine-protein kinase ATR